MKYLAFFVTVLFVQGIPGPATTPRWALLMLVMPILWYRSPNRLTVAHLLGACFLAWAAFSLSWTFNFYDGLRAMLLFGLLSLVFCAAPLSLRSVYGAMAIGLAVNSAVSVAQVYGWGVLSQAAIPGGLFFNKNFAGELAAMVLVGVIASRLWWAIPGILPTLWLSYCRGAFFALAVLSIWLIYQRSRVVALVIAGVGLELIAYLVLRHDTGLWTPSFNQRIDLWLDAWDGFIFWGRGLGSFYTTFPEHATRLDSLLFRPSSAHADLFNLTYELGPGVLLVLGLLLYAWLARPLRAEHYVLIVFLSEGLVAFPLYMPATSFLAVLVLGSLCRDRPGLHSSLAWSRARVLLGQALRYGWASLIPPASSVDHVAAGLPDAGGSSVFLGVNTAVRGSGVRHS